MKHQIGPLPQEGVIYLWSVEEYEGRIYLRVHPNDRLGRTVLVVEKTGHLRRIRYCDGIGLPVDESGRVLFEESDD